MNTNGTKIVPLLVGTAPRNISQLVSGLEPEPLNLAFTMFYVESQGRKLLVDTGIGMLSQTHDHHQPVEQSPEQEPVAALESIGIEAEEIEIVVNTHLHWDHCGGNDLFPNAKFLVQRAEIEYAIAPPEKQRKAYDEVVMEHGACVSIPNFLRGRLSPIEGEIALTEDVTIIPTPGHSPGSQSVIVRGNDTYLLAGDNVPLMENIEGPEFIPNASYTDLDVYLDSMMKAFNISTVTLPSHDHRVFDTAVYQ